MHRPRPIVLLLSLLAFQSPLLPSAALAQSATASQPLVISNVWSRPAQRSRVGVVYLTVAGSGAADRLLSVSSEVADRVELHQSMSDNGVMRMRPVQGLAVPANGKVTLSPGGYHLMLIGLHKDLNPGESFPVILTFQNSGNLTATATVRKPASATGSGGDVGHDMSHMAH